MKITLNDLPKYSEWISKIVGLSPVKKYQKTPENVKKEFNQEKWGAYLLEYIKNSDWTLRDLDDYILRNEMTIFFRRNEFEYINSLEAQKRLVEKYKNILSKYILDATALVEMGAGYGSIFFKLIKDSIFQNMDYYASEYTKSGYELMLLILKNQL